MIPPNCRISLVEQSHKSIIISRDLSGSCGTYHSPLVIEAKPGQTINISNMDFAHRDGGSASSCSMKYGQVTDTSNRRRESMCHSSNRNNQLMLSNGNRVEIALHKNEISGFVLLQFEGKYLPVKINLNKI